MEIHTIETTTLEQVQIIQLIFTILLGMVLAFVAYQQWNTNRIRLRMDMYDKRYAVYRQVHDAMSILRISGMADDIVLAELVKNYHESYYLFHRKWFEIGKADIPMYLEEIAQKCTLMIEATNIVNSTSGIDKAERKRRRHQLTELMEYFTQQIERARNLFGTYLRMG